MSDLNELPKKPSKTFKFLAWQHHSYLLAFQKPRNAYQNNGFIFLDDATDPQWWIPIATMIVGIFSNVECVSLHAMPKGVCDMEQYRFC